MFRNILVSLLLTAALLLPLKGHADDTDPDGKTAPPAKTETFAQSESGMPFSGPAGGAETADEEVPSAEPGEPAAAEETLVDPLEPWNRGMFHFNDKLYFWLLKPVAQGYSFVVPEPLRVGVRNAFTNVTMPVRLVNSLLQGKFKGAGSELARFGLNTALGAGGLLDVATDAFELPAQKEDLGQTLGYYGMGGVFYIVWPVVGPSSLRDTIGRGGDSFLNPLHYLLDMETLLAVDAGEMVNRTSLTLGEYEDLVEAALEPYVAVKDAYVQYRREAVRK